MRIIEDIANGYDENVLMSGGGWHGRRDLRLPLEAWIEITNDNNLLSIVKTSYQYPPLDSEILSLDWTGSVLRAFVKKYFNPS